MGLIKGLKEEIRIIRERDPAIHSSLEVLLYPSLKAMVHYRMAHKLYLSGHYFLARWLSQRGARKSGIEIHPGAKIGTGFFVDHGHGVVIGETAEIGNNVTLYQGVTLGGTGKEQGKRHPTIGDNVMISAGAKVLGSFTIAGKFQDRRGKRGAFGSAAQFHGGGRAGARGMQKLQAAKSAAGNAGSGASARSGARGHCQDTEGKQRADPADFRAGKAA